MTIMQGSFAFANVVVPPPAASILAWGVVDINTGLLTNAGSGNWSSDANSLITLTGQAHREDVICLAASKSGTAGLVRAGAIRVTATDITFRLFSTGAGAREVSFFILDLTAAAAEQSINGYRAGASVGSDGVYGLGEFGFGATGSSGTGQRSLPVDLTDASTYCVLVQCAESSSDFSLNASLQDPSASLQTQGYNNLTADAFARFFVVCLKHLVASGSVKARCTVNGINGSQLGVSLGVSSSGRSGVGVYDVVLSSVLASTDVVVVSASSPASLAFVAGQAMYSSGSATIDLFSYNHSGVALDSSEFNVVVIGVTP